MGGPPLLRAVSAAVTAAVSATAAAIVNASLGPGVTTAGPEGPKGPRTTPDVYSDQPGQMYLPHTSRVKGPKPVAHAGCLPVHCTYILCSHTSFLVSLG